MILSLMDFGHRVPDKLQLRNCQTFVEVPQENMRASLLPMESVSLSQWTESEEYIISPLTYKTVVSARRITY